MTATLALLALLAAPGEGTIAWRLQADPRDSAEAAVREAALRDGAAAVPALAAVSDRFPGTEASGLARLAAGLRLLELGRPADAVAHLAHADVPRTLLRDHALLALGRAQQALGREDEAARSFLAAGAEPSGTVACTALPSATALLARARPSDPALLRALEDTAASCPREAPAALLQLGTLCLAAGDRKGAALAFDRLDREHPASAPARQARTHLASLSAALPPRSAEERARLRLDRGVALLAAGQSAEAVAALRAVPLASLAPAEADLARVRLGRALLLRGRTSEGRALLQKVPRESPHAAEAAFHLARDRARRTKSPDAYAAVADGFPGTTWGEEALLSLANDSQKEALDEAALPWWRRLVAEYPEGRYVERAVWRVAWADYRARRYEAAARLLESTARLRPPSGSTPGFLYWSARACLGLGQADRARALLAETVQRYKHAYHGVRAADALARLGGPAPRPALVALSPPPEPPLPEPRATRVRQLLLVERLDEAASDLRVVPESARVQATLAWIDGQKGRLRPAITAMKRAFPEWVGEAGDRLPREVWQILFPLRYEAELKRAARDEGLDPALVASLILQESTFDASALSRAGARGLMQVMPATGRTIARAKGQRFRRAALHDPETSLDFGTHYLRQMSERFPGAVEKVLASYNAGPHRVDAWTAARGELPAEEFIEGIPFSETRTYVMIVLANREQYRRLYGLDRTAPGPAVEGARP